MSAYGGFILGVLAVVVLYCVAAAGWYWREYRRAVRGRQDEHRQNPGAR